MFAVPENTVPTLSDRSLNLSSLIRAVTAEPPRWRELLSHSGAAVLPYDDPRVRIWLSVWPPGGPAATRTYDAPQGAFAVLSGLIVERSGGGARTLRPGQVRVFGPGYRHRVLNAGAEQAVTVHLQIHA